MTLTRGLVLDVANQLGGAEPSLVTLHDWSRGQHNCSMHDVTWAQTPTGLWYKEYEGNVAYCDAAAAATRDMDFTGDYSILCWIRWIENGLSQIVIGRYELDDSGWEIYLARTGVIDYLTQRHHHAGTIVDGHPRTASYSIGWNPDTNWFMAITRVKGDDGVHYRNGEAMAITSSAGGLLDPEPCGQDLTIGVRYTKNSTYFYGDMARLKVYNYAMTPAQVRARYHAEKYLFGVTS